jgi:uncharacterized membrane protein required for colicin V production
LLAVSVAKIVKMTMLRVLDRVTGALLGLIMGMIVASLLIAVTLELPFPPQFRKDIASSSMVLFLRPMAGQVFNWVAAHGAKGKHFEEFFRHGNTV